MRLQFEKTILSSWNALNIYIFLNFTKNCENTYFIMFFVVFSTDNVVLRCFFASCHVWFKYSVKCSDTAKGLKKCVHTIKEKKEDLARMSTDIQQGEGGWPKCQLTVNRVSADCQHGDQSLSLLSTWTMIKQTYDAINMVLTYLMVSFS